MITLYAMGNFQSDLVDAMNNRGKGDVADAVGMPDQQDYEVIVRIIKRYNQLRPGLLDKHMELVRAEFRSGRYGKNILWKGHAEVNEASHMRYALELPEDLGRAIERFFPTMFHSKKHLRWFTKKFPELTVSGKPL